MAETTQNRNPAEVDPRETEERRPKQTRTNSDRLAGLAHINVKANDQSAPFIEQILASWVAVRKVCEAAVACSSYSLSDWFEWYALEELPVEVRDKVLNILRLA